MEASRSLGISYGKDHKIILPQTTKIMLPNFVNQFVIALKDTTIVSRLGLLNYSKSEIIIAQLPKFQDGAIRSFLPSNYYLKDAFAKQLEKRANLNGLMSMTSTILR